MSVCLISCHLIRMFFPILVSMFSHIGTALAFSPRFEAVLIESFRIATLFDAEITIIHIGEKNEEKEKQLNACVHECKFKPKKITIEWHQGDPAKKILAVCRKNKIDLLIAGALKKENIFRYYLGSVARTILRRASCSVLVLTDPSKYPKPFKQLVINGEQSPCLEPMLEAGFDLARRERSSQIHILRDIQLYGLNLIVAGEESTEDEYGEARKKLVQDEITGVEDLLKKFPESENFKINIKVTAGKTGFEVVKFAERFEVDLIIYCAPERRLKFIDRFFPHDMEYVLADMPTNLMVFHP